MFMVFTTLEGVKVYICEDCFIEEAKGLCPSTIKKLYDEMEAVNIPGRDY